MSSPGCLPSRIPCLNHAPPPHPPTHMRSHARRAVLPALHKRYIAAMLDMFGGCAQHGSDMLLKAHEVRARVGAKRFGTLKGPGGGAGRSRAARGGPIPLCLANRLTLSRSLPPARRASPTRAMQEGRSVEMENFFSRFGLDIIGKAVFNYDFDSLTTDDPVIQVGAWWVVCVCGGEGGGKCVGGDGGMSVSRGLQASVHAGGAPSPRLGGGRQRAVPHRHTPF